MFEAKITIACPDLALAASALAAAINFRTPGADPKAPAHAQTPAAIPVQAAAPAQPPMHAQQPAMQQPPMTATFNPATPAYTPAIPAVTPPPAYTYTPATSAPAPVAPTAPAPTYTMDQITKAGAELAQAGKMANLMALLQGFGVQAVTQVPQERLGELANALRGLGAKL